jgi:hypothetical protein
LAVRPRAAGGGAIIGLYCGLGFVAPAGPLIMGAIIGALGA